VDQLVDTVERIRAALEAKNAARDIAYNGSRQLTRCCAKAVTAAHRADWSQVHSLLAEARTVAGELAIPRTHSRSG